jgi:hypothetical protein
MLSFCEPTIMFPFQGVFCCECFVFNVTTTCYNKSSNIVCKFFNPGPITFKVVFFCFFTNVALNMLNYVIFLWLSFGGWFRYYGFSYYHGGHCDNVCQMKLDKV